MRALRVSGGALALAASLGAAAAQAGVAAMPRIDFAGAAPPRTP
jgi:hypothetical protein